MFVKCIEKTGACDFGFCEQGDNPVCQGRKWPEERMQFAGPYGGFGGLAYTE
jgi:hypothetical protein